MRTPATADSLCVSTGGPPRTVPIQQLTLSGVTLYLGRAPDPEYSEEARKAKYQGTVVLWAIIGADGLAKDIRVQQPLGMGLDQKAVAAVRPWRFDPARKSGQPVAVQVNIEMHFRLY